LFTYAKIEYVSVRTYLSKNKIRTLRIIEPCSKGICSELIISEVSVLVQRGSLERRQAPSLSVRDVFMRQISWQHPPCLLLLRAHDVSHHILSVTRLTLYQQPTNNTPFFQYFIPTNTAVHWQRKVLCLPQAAWCTIMWQKIRHRYRKDTVDKLLH